MDLYAEQTTSSNVLLRHIFPFCFKDESKDLSELIKNYSDNLLNLKNCGDYPKGDNSELYHHIESLITHIDYDSDDENRVLANSTIGVHLSKTFNLSKIDGRINTIEIIIIDDLNEQLTIRIPYFQLYIFKTQIAFLSIPIEIQNLISDEQLMTVSALLKSVKQSRRKKKGDGVAYNGFFIRVTPKKKSKEDCPEPVDYTYEEFICELTMDFKDCSFFNGSIRTSSDSQDAVGYSVPHKALVFSSYCGVKTQLDVNALKNMVRLSKGYDDKYGVGESFFCENSIERLKQDIFWPFEDVYWSISREGISNLVLRQSGDAKTFLSGAYFDRVSQNYIYMYILALHQYYGLIHMSRELSEIPDGLESYTSQKKEMKVHSKANYKALVALQDKIYFFYLKCIYEDVSHISHQDAIYKQIKETFSIRNMIQELDFEISKLGFLIKDIRTAEIELIEKKKNKRIQFLTTGGGILVFFSAYSELSKKSVAFFKWVCNLLNVSEKSLIGLTGETVSGFSEFAATIAFLLIIYGCGIGIEWICRKLSFD